MTSMKHDMELRQVNLLSELSVVEDEERVNRKAELGPPRDIYEQPLTPPISPLPLATESSAKPAPVVHQNREGSAFSSLKKVLGRISSQIIRAHNVPTLSCFECVERAGLDASQMSSLDRLMVDRRYKTNSTILGAGTKKEASLYFVREGKVRLVSESCDRVVKAGGHFGEDLFVSRCSKGSTTSTIKYTVTALTETVCAVLSLKDCQTVFDTDVLLNANVPGHEEIAIPQKTSRRALEVEEHTEEETETVTEDGSLPLEEAKLGLLEEKPGFKAVIPEEPTEEETETVTEDTSLPLEEAKPGVKATILEEPTEEETETLAEDAGLPLEEAKPDFSVPLQDLKKHKILGEGMFGQVWLVSQNLTDGTVTRPQPYALKIQSKYDLALEGQIENVVREKEIMSKMLHPFIINLVATYQDETFVYMLLDMVQGGELFSIMHREDGDDPRGLPESQAKFYALCIADALAYMHRGKLVYRDLKPENVMLDARGYPVLIDFGYAKYVSDKTYTMCGTPAYLPPEVVMTEGHDCSADHWSLGILIYEMIAGENPFYFDGMEQMTLFECIVEDGFKPLSGVSPEVNEMVLKLLAKDPVHRLGSLAGGEDDIIGHPWFQTQDLSAMRRREVVAPWIPKLKDAFDTGCFDDWDHLEDKSSLKFPDLERRDAALFEGF